MGVWSQGAVLGMHYGLEFYSVWPFFVCMAILVWIVSSPLFAGADTPPNPRPNRVLTMDGLRGFLAFAVVFHHAAIFHHYLQSGVWSSPPSRFFALLGPLGVDLFFMITGYLFWGQLLRSEGRPGWIRLYVGRLFRIGPLYLFTVAVSFAIVAAQSHFTLLEPITKLAIHLVRWLSLGLLGISPLNGDAGASMVLLGMAWTLQFEWCFYLSLPLLAFAARSKRLALGSVLLALLLCQTGLHLLHWHLISTSRVSLFLLGMLCASVHSFGWMSRLPRAVGSILIVLLLALEFRFNGAEVTSAGQLILALVLYLILSGHSIFGLLEMRAALRLGDISYGIYLLQGLVLGLVFQQGRLKTPDVNSPLIHWAMCLLTGFLLLCLATLTHTWIERPGIEWGKRIVLRLKRAS